MIGGGTPLAPSCSNSDSPPKDPDPFRSSEEAFEVADMLEVLYFLPGGAGGLRLTPFTGVCDLDPALGVLEEVDWKEAAEPGRSIPRVCP